MNARRLLQDPWPWRGLGVALLVSACLLVLSLCPAAGEVPFAIALIGSLICGALAFGARRRYRRSTRFLAGMTIGFAAGFPIELAILLALPTSC